MTPCTPVVSRRFTRCQEASSAAAAQQATSWMMSCRHQPQLPNIQRCCVAMLHACPARRTKHLPTRPPEQAKRILARYVSILQGMNACKPIKARILNLHSPHLLKRKMGLHESHGCCNNTGKQIHMGSIRHIFQLHQLFVSLSFHSSDKAVMSWAFLWLYGRCGLTNAPRSWPCNNTPPSPKAAKASFNPLISSSRCAFLSSYDMPPSKHCLAKDSW